MKGFEAVAEAIARRGVREVFTYMSRDIIKPLAELEARGVRVVQTHHEHGAIGAADGYARTTGRTGIVFVGAGVGLTNGMNALITAAKAHSQVVVFVGEAPGAASGSPSARAVNKYVNQRALLDALEIRHLDLANPGSMIADIAQCLDLATVCGELLVVSLPNELLEGESADGPAMLGIDAPVPQGLSPDDLEAIVDILLEPAAARRTVILGGRGALNAGAAPDLLRLGEATGALMSTSAMANRMFAASPYSVGIAGTFASPVASELLTSATLVLAFGASLNRFTSYGGDMFGKARIIRIDDKPAEFGRYYRHDIEVVADARLAAAQIADELERRNHRVTGYRTPETAATIAGWRIEDSFTDRSSASGIDPRTLMSRLEHMIPRERTLVVDVGHFMDFPIAHLSVPNPRAFVWPVEYTSIASGLGPAIGASIAHPERMTVFLTGDGSFMMSLADLHSAVRHRLKLLVVVCNDGALSGELHYLNDCGYSGEIAHSVHPGFEGLARSLGLQAVTINGIDDLEAVRQALADLQGPMLLDCRVTREVQAGSRDLFRSLINKGVV